MSLSLNRVSDDNYWRDFTRVSPGLTQRLLPNDLNLSWSRGYFSTSLRMLKWQTLQDVTSPIVPPYDRMPQLAMRYARSNLNGFDMSVDADATHFNSDSTLDRAAQWQPRVFGIRGFAALGVSVRVHHAQAAPARDQLPVRLRR